MDNGNRGDEEVLGMYGVKDRNAEGQMVVDFAKRMEMAVVNMYFQKREEHRVTYKSGGRCTQVDYILSRRCHLKEIGDCKVVPGESVARQHRVVVCRMRLETKKRKRVKTEPKIRWWKLKEEDGCRQFREKLQQALGGSEEPPEDWETTAKVVRETGKNVLGVSSGQRKEDKESWWWNEEVQESIQKKKAAKKKWDNQRDEGSRQEYCEASRIAKRMVAKAKAQAYDELYERLDSKEGVKDLYRLAKQRDRAGKDVQQARLIKDREGNVLLSEQRVLSRWKEYFEELMNEENERERRTTGGEIVDQEVQRISKVEVRAALKRMKNGKAVGPDDIPVESNGQCRKEVKKRVQAGWSGWRRVSGLICDRRIAARVKGKVYKTVVRPAMTYGLETVALSKRQEAELEVAEMKMLRFSLGVTRMDKIRNEQIRGTVKVEQFGDKAREARLRWFGHVLRRNSGYIGQRMLEMELPGRRRRGRPQRRFMDVVKVDMEMVGVNVEEAVDRARRRQMIRCGDP
ncbi:hypothetical protein SRHO_G00089370 [Serrasalmus rhombeus]